MVLVLAVVVALALHVALRRGLPPAVALAGLWTRLRPQVLRYLAAAPATFLYLFIIATTTWVLVGVSSLTATSILHQHSSNLHELNTNPVKALIRSAFLLDDYTELAGAAFLAVALAPVERWLGTARWLVVFAVGHAGATITTAFAIWLAIRTGHASRSLETTVDVGVSYGFAAVAGVLVWGLPRRRALAWATMLGAILVAALALSRTFTDVGHLVAFAIGLGLRPLATSLPHGRPGPDPFATARRALQIVRGRIEPGVARPIVEVEVLGFAGCPNVEPASLLVERIARELGGQVEIVRTDVADAEAAERLRFPGSPTVRIAGRDVEPGADDRGAYVYGCRLYRTEAGASGLPDEELVRRALAAALEFAS